MFQSDDKDVRELLFAGRFGLEKESLRVDREGHFVHTPHPFPGNAHIVRDFCENQTEINSPVADSAQDAVASVDKLTREIQRRLAREDELLWPFSNPPYIRDENDIPVARFTGGETPKTLYRHYLSGRYGRRKMAFSGIHFNFSFAEELLRADFARTGGADFAAYKNRVYLDLARRMAEYGWLITALTAASPVIDRSLIELGACGEDVFTGFASVRCGELGYWNFFAPVLDYTSVEGYADSIRKYVAEEWILSPGELYYPVRLKPSGKNSLSRLLQYGIDHIELRMFDLNPLRPEGIDARDLEFTHLMMVYLASTPGGAFNARDQINAVQNFKNAAHYDLRTVPIVLHDRSYPTVAEAALDLLRAMKEFYRGFGGRVESVLAFEERKLLHPETRYAAVVRERFSGGFVTKGLELAAARQQEAVNDV